jgi:putative membrane protein
VLAAAAHAYLAKLLFARAPQLPPGSPHTVTEQEQAAQWMYYGGDIAEVLLATALFASWYRSEAAANPAAHANPTE